MGSMNESMFVVKEGEKLRIGFNPKFLLEMLRVIDDEEVFMYFTSAKTPCTVRDEKTVMYIWFFRSTLVPQRKVREEGE